MVVHWKPKSKIYKASHALSINNFPALCKTTPTTNINIMNYAGVTSLEVPAVEKKETVRDGWVKISREPSGFVTRKYGKSVQNTNLNVLDESDLSYIRKQLVARHAEYRQRDNETYFNNYIYSWQLENETAVDNDDGELDEDYWSIHSESGNDEDYEDY